MIDTIIENIVVDGAFADMLAKNFQDIAPEVITFHYNPECCEKNVREYIDQHLDEVSSFYTKYVGGSHKKNEVGSEKSTEPQTDGQRSLIGDVIEIEPDPIAYSNMIKHINTEGWKYNGVSMMETEKTEPSTGETEVIWLAFFY